jgi:hypothetical protein
VKLFLLKPIQKAPKYDPWDPWYDKAFGFVVRAEDETMARQFASEQAGNEEDAGFGNPWLSSYFSTCVELSHDGEMGVILQDTRSA